MAAVRWAYGIVLVLGSVSVNARAEPVDTRPSPSLAAPRPVEASVGVFWRNDFGYVCQQHFDVIGCTSVAFQGVSLAPRWRLSRPFSVGLFAAWGWGTSGLIAEAGDGSHEDPALALWRLEAEGRWHPLGTYAVDPWVGLDFGLTGLRDSVKKYGPGGQYAQSASATQLGPVGGLGIGLDVHPVSVLAVGIEMRGSVQSFGHAPPVLLPEEQLYAQDYGTHVAWSIGLSGTILAGPRPQPQPPD
jgi:hypothetical protein